MSKLSDYLFSRFFSRIILNYLSYAILSFGILASVFWLMNIDMAVSGGIFSSWLKAIAPAQYTDPYTRPAFDQEVNIFKIYVFFALLLYPIIEFIKKVMEFMGKKIPEVSFKEKVIYSFGVMFVLGLLGSVSMYVNLEPSQQKHVFPLIFISVITFIFAFTSVYMFIIFRNYIKLKQEKEHPTR